MTSLDQSRITAVFGAYAELVRTGADCAAPGMSPMDVLTSMAEHGWAWKITWPAVIDVADSDVFDWVRADLARRMLLAALHGRAVRFAGHRYVLPADANSEEFATPVKEIDDAVGGGCEPYAGIFIGDDRKRPRHPA